MACMGAWGHKSFENDSALDWLGDLTDGDASLVGEAIDAVAGANDDAYIDVDEASAALAAAELVAAALGKGEDRLNDGAASWLTNNRATVQGVGAARARLAVQRVFEHSELRELWDENGDETEWHADVRELLQRLT
jgi:hypothetical protein